MLFVQLAQVLLSRPKRGRTFWGIVAYSSIILPLTTLAIGGMLKFMEMAYIDHRDEMEPIDYFEMRGSEPVNMMSQIKCVFYKHWIDDVTNRQRSITLVPWIGDLLIVRSLVELSLHFLGVNPDLINVSALSVSSRLES